MTKKQSELVNVRIKVLRDDPYFAAKFGIEWKDVRNMTESDIEQEIADHEDCLEFVHYEP